MRKTIIKIVSICLILLTSFSLFALPIFELDVDYLVQKYEDKITTIKDTDDPDAKIDHTFTKETFDKANNGKIELDEEAKASFDVVYYDSYEEVEGGVKFKNGIKLTSEDVKDLVRLSIWASGENAKLIIEVDDVEVKQIELTQDIQKYVVEVKETDGAKLELTFTSTTTLHRLKVNEDDLATFDDAKKILLDRIILFSGIIVNDPSLVDVENKTIYGAEDQVNEVLRGVNFFSLFNMFLRDVKYDISLVKQLQEVDKTVDLPFSAKLDYYTELRFCPFVSLLVFISALAIVGSFVYVVVSFVIDLIMKKNKTNIMIPSLIALGGLMVLLNISTFMGPNFFNDTHNIATEYRIFFFEIAKSTRSFICASVLIMILACVNFVDVAFDFKESLTLEKKNNLKIYFVITLSLVSIMVLLSLLGLFIR